MLRHETAKPFTSTQDLEPTEKNGKEVEAPAAAAAAAPSAAKKQDDEKERKEREAAERLAKQERFEAIMIYGGVAVGLSIGLGITVVIILGMQGRL